MDLDGSESDETKKGQVGFFVTDGETPILLELAEEHLDASPPAVNHLIVNDLDLTVFAPGDDGKVVVGTEFATVSVAVVAHVCDDIQPTMSAVKASAIVMSATLPPVSWPSTT
jgi:hypothetical protein